MLKARVIVFLSDTMDNFQFNFLSWGQLESVSLDKFFITVFKIIPCLEVFLLVALCFPLLLERSVEIISILNSDPLVFPKLNGNTYHVFFSLKSVESNLSLRISPLYGHLCITSLLRSRFLGCHAIPKNGCGGDYCITDSLLCSRE